MAKISNRRDLVIGGAAAVLLVLAAAGAAYSYQGVRTAQGHCRASFEDYYALKALVARGVAAPKIRRGAGERGAAFDDINSLLETVARRAGIPVEKVRRVAPERERKTDDGEGVERPVRVFLDGLGLQRLISFIEQLQQSGESLEVTEIVIEEASGTAGSDLWSLDLSLSLFSP